MQDRDDRANPVKRIVVVHAGAISAKKSQRVVWGFRRRSIADSKSGHVVSQAGTCNPRIGKNLGTGC
jgi:hypothetical protein